MSRLSFFVLGRVLSVLKVLVIRGCGGFFGLVKLFIVIVVKKLVLVVLVILVMCFSSLVCGGVVLKL